MSEMGRPRETAPIGYVTVSEAAALLGVTVQAIYNRIKAGTIPYEKSLKRNGQSCYYLSQEWIEQEKKEKAGRVQRAPEAQTNLDDISEHLAALSEGQEELQQAVREILAATQTDAPRASSDEPKPAVGNTARGEGNGQRIPYERADDPEFQDLVGRDVRGQSTPEERALLRSPENLQLWRDGLRAILSDLETQRIQRKADAEAFRTECMRQGPSGKQEWFDFKAEWDAWKGGASRFTRSVQTSLAEAKRLAQEHQQHDEKERFRRLLVESLDFLNEDEAITYKYTPDRDTLREKISGALYKTR